MPVAYEKVYDARPRSSSRARREHSLSVAEIGSFHVGGRAVSLAGLPTRDVVFTAGSAPIKVDPKPGWQMFFLGAGHDVYVSDAVERGRASWAWEDFRIGPVGSDKGLMK